MNKAQLIEKVKRNKGIYIVYKYTMSLLVNTLKHFVKTDDKLILFVSYGGRYYSDSPKCIYEYMKNDPRFDGYRLVWAFREPGRFDVEHRIKIDTLNYFVIALKARVWVANVMIERAVPFRGKHTYYFHTTHGTLPKLTGADAGPDAFGSDFKFNYDCSCAQSETEAEYQMNMFGLKKEQILICGYPKNDALAKATSEDRERILKKLSISPDKKVILYAPTFRDGAPDAARCPIDLKMWEDRLGDGFVFLFRAHPVVASGANIDSSTGFAYDVSSYPDNSELMIASDYLISDYSGIFFEYAVLRRPMFCYAYDYDEYQKIRGLYFDIRKELPGGDEEFIIDHIKHTTDEDIRLVNSFIDKYVSEFGNATKAAVDNIYNSITQ
jgi:CDP-glycerol glycerophosphotransferase